MSGYITKIKMLSIETDFDKQIALLSWKNYLKIQISVSNSHA